MWVKVLGIPSYHDYFLQGCIADRTNEKLREDDSIIYIYIHCIHIYTWHMFLSVCRHLLCMTSNTCNESHLGAKKAWPSKSFNFFLGLGFPFQYIIAVNCLSTIHDPTTFTFDKFLDGSLRPFPHVGCLHKKCKPIPFMYGIFANIKPYSLRVV